MKQNKHGKTACQWADDFGQPEIATMLRKAGGDPPVVPTLPPEVSHELCEDLLLTVEQVGGPCRTFRPTNACMPSP